MCAIIPMLRIFYIYYIDFVGRIAYETDFPRRVYRYALIFYLIDENLFIFFIKFSIPIKKYQLSTSYLLTLFYISINLLFNSK